MFIHERNQDLIVDDIFGKSLKETLEDIKIYNPEYLDTEGGKCLESLFEPGIFFQDIPCGVMLINKEKTIIGGYFSYDLVVDEAYRGKGLGIELVIERCLRDGENPLSNLDEASYSRKGLRAHESAWLHTRQNPEETRQRLSRWEGA